MANPAKKKGDNAELEVARLLAELTGYPVRRKLGAGRADDAGDLDGIPRTCVQVKNYADPARAIREALSDLEAQRCNAGADFAAALVRRRGGRWGVVMSPEQFAALVVAAIGPRPGDRSSAADPGELGAPRPWDWTQYVCDTAGPWD